MGLRINYFILSCFLLVPGTLGLSAKLFAQETEDDPLAAIITPGIERREIETADIDSENWEIGSYGGLISIEDFGSNYVGGVRVAYHLMERLFIEVSGGISEAKETSFERLSGSTEILSDSQREYLYYDASLGVNIFNGQLYLGKEHALNGDVYFTAGVGNTYFADDTYFTSSLGIGSRVYITDWIAAHADLDIRSFEHELLGEEKVIYNTETTIGLTFFF